MVDRSQIDYSHLDRPEILRFLFHPRGEYRGVEKPPNATDVLIPVEDNVVIGGHFHVAQQASPNLLFFHGNGEIVADYDEMGPLYNRMGINFLAVDYRGYGRSTGSPTITAMMRDCHEIFEFSVKWLKDKGCAGPLIAIGRSLGSASALELASHYKDRLSGLVIESGFAYAGPLLRLLGINPDAISFKEEKGFRNLDKIRTWDKPALIIHAELDQIIPFSEGEALYHACPSSEKTLLKIPFADHNDIFVRGLREYLSEVAALARRAGAAKGSRSGV
ncbi:MAG: alpha/beta hydrolase fold protein [Deltaproteobacteria bacterium]|nr:alpha/beta hydrolase fold protein [Deltaproteobacteria bacterium]